ncbi:MAG: YbaK/EbsC family protein [Acidobacteriota bacterium]
MDEQVNHDAPPVLTAIRDLLAAHDVPFRELVHEPTFTCEESAAARGEPIDIGGKCLLMKVGDSFGLYVMSAALQLKSRKLRHAKGERRMRFASREELLEMTGLVPGSVPPFGEPILPFPLHADESITRNDRIAFNAGSLRHSLILSTEDYLRVASPTILSYAE